MRKPITFLICILCMFASTAALATSPEPVQDKNNPQIAKDHVVLLYNSPEKSAASKKLPPNLRLIPIYRQGNWVKVGDPRNGDTGWIDIVQYEKARYNYYRPNIQTLFVRLDNNNKNGKRTLNVVAYRNGKPISKEEAMKLYQQLQKDQQNQFEKMQKLSLSMQSMMDQDFLNAEHFFDASLFSPSWMGPVILIQTPDKNGSPKQSPAAKSSKNSEGNKSI